MVQPSRVCNGRVHSFTFIHRSFTSFLHILIFFTLQDAEYSVLREVQPKSGDDSLY